MRLTLALLAVAACGPVEPRTVDGPEPFGITMVEETACIGAGGAIADGPEGPYCRMPQEGTSQ